MRLGRIASPDGVAFVSIEGEGDSAIAKEIAEHPFGTPTFTGRSWPLADVRLLAPILASKVIAVGRNYAAHAAESGNEVPDEPVIFLKPNTSIVGPGAPIVIPRNTSLVHHEAELAVVIGRPCKDVTAAKAREASSATRSPTMCPPATIRRRTANGPAPRGTTPSVLLAPGSKPIWTPPTSRSPPRSMGCPASAAGLR